MRADCKQATVYYGERITQPPGVSITVDEDIAGNLLKIPLTGQPRVTLEQALELLEAQWQRDHAEPVPMDSLL